MSEQDKKLDELTTQEFAEVMDKAAEPDFHDLPIEDFFTALAAIDAEAFGVRPELKATVTSDHFIYTEPAPRT